MYDIGYIYIIWDIEDPTLIYYGSTGDVIARMVGHKTPNNPCSSKQIMERGKYEYAILETYENIDEYDLVERESWFIRNKQCVNKHVPHRTVAEYYQDNKTRLAEYKAEYYQDNKDKIAEYKAEYYQDNKDKNKDKFQEKFVCECGGKFTIQNKAVHEKTQRHLKYIEIL